MDANSTEEEIIALTKDHDLMIEVHGEVPWCVIKQLESIDASPKDITVHTLTVKCSLVSLKLAFNYFSSFSDIIVDRVSVSVREIRYTTEDLVIVSVFSTQTIDQENARTDCKHIRKWSISNLRSDTIIYMCPVQCSRSMLFRILVFRLPTFPPLDVELWPTDRADRTHCDVVIEVEDKQFHAHRAVLASRSPVLKAMFSDDFKEKAEGRVVIEEISKSVFGMFIDFLYTGHITASCTLAEEVELLEVADRYMVKVLERTCIRRLRRVKKEDVVSLLQLLLRKPSAPSEVLSIGAKLVIDNWDYIARTDEWTKLRETFPMQTDLIIGGYMSHQEED